MIPSLTLSRREATIVDMTLSARQATEIPNTADRGRGTETVARARWRSLVLMLLPVAAAAPAAVWHPCQQLGVSNSEKV